MTLPSRLSAVLALVALAAPSVAAEPSWDKVGAALGKAGSMQPGGVYRVALPRSDLHVTLDGVVGAVRPGGIARRDPRLSERSFSRRHAL